MPKAIGRAMEWPDSCPRRKLPEHRLMNNTILGEAIMREVIMGYQGEMSLKGLNRTQFESAMMIILRYRLKTVGRFRC